MKRYRIVATFEQPKIPYRIQEITILASNLPAAVARGMREILRRKGVARLRHRRVDLTVHILADIPVENLPSNPSAN